MRLVQASDYNRERPSHYANTLILGVFQANPCEGWVFRRRQLVAAAGTVYIVQGLLVGQIPPTFLCLPSQFRLGLISRRHENQKKVWKYKYTI
jgi:hypothetical protein